MTHSTIPATLADVPIFIAFDRTHHQPLCVMADGQRTAWGPLSSFLPLLPDPTVREATRIFAPQRFQRDLAGKLTAKHYRQFTIDPMAAGASLC